MTEVDALRTEWWLATLGRTLVWARLRVLDAGTAEVFDSDGNTLAYDSEDTARAALMDAEFVAFDGLDEDVAGKPVHILVNNTGGPPGGPAHSAAASAYLDAFQRHLLANQLLVQAVSPGMRSDAWGRIVNVISTSVREPIPNLGVSNTVRGAVAGWAKTLSRELAPHGITVNNVLPGYTETGRIAQILQDRAAASGQSEEAVAEGMRKTVPAGRFARPAEVAAAIAFLCTPAAAYINGVSLAVDGGRMQSI